MEMRFRPEILIKFVFAQSFLKFLRNGDIRLGLSDCERMISVDYILNALDKALQSSIIFCLHTLYIHERSVWIFLGLKNSCNSS